MEVQYKGFTVRDDGTVINKYGKKVGFKVKNGYRHIVVNYKQILEHRFIWEAFNGEIPEKTEIDHINTIRDDNRLCNLRLVSSSENKRNPKTLERYKESNKGKLTEQCIEARKKYIAEHNKVIIERIKEYYQAKKEQKNTYYSEHKKEKAIYYQANKKKRLEYQAKYRAEHKKEIAIYNAKYYLEHKKDHKKPSTI